jgi:hypothetical protein
VRPEVANLLRRKNGQTGSDGARYIGAAGLPDLYGERDLLQVRSQEERRERESCGLAAQTHR